MPTANYQAALDSNDLVMSYAKQADFATPPTTGFRAIRLDGEGFSSQKSRTRPSEINPSGQASASLTTKIEATGSLNFSVSGGTFNDMLASSIGGSWSAPEVVSDGGMAITAAGGGTITLAAGLDVFEVGALLKLRCKGANSTNISGMTFRVATKSATAMVVVAVSNPNSVVLGTATAASDLGCAVLKQIGWTNMTTLSYAVTGSKITDSGNGFTAAKGWKKGMYIRTTGSTTAGNNQIYQVTSVAANGSEIAVSPAPAQAEAFAATTIIQAGFVRNGLVFDAFLFQKQMAADKFFVYPAAFPTGGSLDIGVGDYLKGTMSFLCKSEAKGTANASTSGNVIDAPVGNVIDSMGGISNVKFNGSAIAAAVNKVGVKWNKEGAAGQYAIGDTAARGMRKGTFTATGTLATYFADFTLYDAFIAETAGALSYMASDNASAGAAAANTYVFTICKGTIMNPKVVAGGQGQDVMAEFEIEGNPDTTGLYDFKTFQIDFFEATTGL